MLCVISSKKLSILVKWATGVREDLKGRKSAWLVGRWMRVEKLNESLKRVLVEGSLVGMWIGKLKGR